MTKSDAKKLSLGLYRLHWKSGGTSLAAVGMTYSGDRWYAPTNWLLTVPYTKWRDVARATLIMTNE